MSNKNKKFLDEFIVFTIIAVMMLALNWMKFSHGMVNRVHFAGFLLGLLCGQLAVCSLELSRVVPNKRVMLRSVSIFLFFGVTFIFALLSKRLSYGYISGIGITGGFGFAVVALLRRYNRTGKLEEQTRRSMAGTGAGG